MKPLFIPLKREHYEAFESGEKYIEYRPYGPRWNEKTCLIGRPVVLSLGYGKKRRLHGAVQDFVVSELPCQRPYWIKIYGYDRKPAACIGIKLNRGQP